MRLVLATRNQHKLREFARLLDGVVLEPLPADVTLPPEDGDTFAANALGKARAAAAALGRAAIADDSGVEAEAPAGSGLRYVCVIAYAEPGGEGRTFEGTCTGRLAHDARGHGGFGYDPAFLPDDVADGRTMAELSDAEKDAISHRGRAARALLSWLRPGSPRAS